MDLLSHFRPWMRVLVLPVLAFSLALTSCNRAYTRIPGASLNFPPTATQFRATKQRPGTLVVALPVDVRSQYYGKEVAGSDWYATSTDALFRSVPKLIQERMVQEIRASGLFAQVTTGPAGPDDWVLNSEVRAFCSDSRGFLWVRIVGMTSLHVSLEKGGRRHLDQTFERAVTDASEEYTGANAGFIEHIMKVVISDSLRETLRDLLRTLDTTL